jgi:3-hydroxyacyl-CoA dehydrogenase
MTTINNVTALGTGNLGSQIAYQTAYSGFEVIAYDINDKILETTRKRVEELAARYEQEVEGAAGGRARTALGRIRYSSNLADAVRDADLVIESAPELPDIKKELYAKLGPLAPEKTIFATNSSTKCYVSRAPCPRESVRLGPGADAARSVLAVAPV